MPTKTGASCRAARGRSGNPGGQISRHRVIISTAAPADDATHAHHPGAHWHMHRLQCSCKDMRVGSARSSTKQMCSRQARMVPTPLDTKMKHGCMTACMEAFFAIKDAQS